MMDNNYFGREQKESYLKLEEKKFDQFITLLDGSLTNKNNWDVILNILFSFI